MIQIYKRENADLENNGDMVIFPTSCILNTQLNGAWELLLNHPIDEEGRWKYIEEEAVVCAPTFQGERQKFRIRKVEKTDEEIEAIAYPIFFDSGKDCFLVDTRPEVKNGQQALDIMTSGTKYSGKSDITTISTAYFIRRNLLDAINGEDEPTFIQRWGGEILYDNYKVIIDERVGGDYGTEVRYGKNMNGLSYSLDMSEMITRIVPVAYNGHTLPGDKPYVDSPNIEKYAIIYTKEIKFDNVKLRADVQTSDEGNGTIICESLEELYEELRRQCDSQFEMGVDLPKVTIEVNMVDLSKTEEYKEYKILEKVGLGDTVHCHHRRLDITTDARVIELSWDCIRNVSDSMKLGEFEFDCFSEFTSAVDTLNKIIGPGNTVVAERIQGVINAIKTQLRYQKNIAQRQDVRAILFEDLDPESETFGAMCLGTLGFEIACERTADGRDWNWTTFGTGRGFFADCIVAGTMLADRIKGGTLTLGGYNNQNGKMRILNASREEIGRWDKDGVYATGKYTCDSPLNDERVELFNGAICFSNKNGSKPIFVEYSEFPQYGSSIIIRAGGTYTSLEDSKTLLRIFEKAIYFDADTVGPGLAGVTGRAQFSDGSYLDFKKGFLIGGRTSEGGTF